MTGWIWCETCVDHCRTCGRFVTGVWRHFVTALTSNMSVCAKCAESA